jgi:hypothetical protein
LSQSQLNFFGAGFSVYIYVVVSQIHKQQEQLWIYAEFIVLLLA